jgi:two-component system, chemotaxis family, CheB/CheR fusion protein
MHSKKNGKKKSDGSLNSKNEAVQKKSFPIVGIGASAGGLEAFEQFFRNMSPDSGIAFILIPHLDPNHASLLVEILQRSTTMPITEAKDHIAVEPNHVYVIPPNRDMTILNRILQLSIQEGLKGLRMPIDSFLRSLADDQGENAIGVILSGTGTDGTLGLRAIHGAGGVSFVQDPSTAKYDGMPNSAIKSGMITYVLPADKLPAQLMIYSKTLYGRGLRPVPSEGSLPASSISKIMLLLRSRTGHDFSLYKQNTIGRRIERRMTSHGIEDLNIYVRYLHEHPKEVQLLLKELLINVTSFFRDTGAFEALKTDILPLLFKEKSENYTFRIWSPACATGEEAYSIAILLKEYMEEIKQDFKVQIYGTDIDDDSIAKARSGVYPPNIAIDISPERLRRFFIKEENGYRVKKEIREMVIFAIQNVIKDPPFTRLDLISCRNLLIYLEPELQDKVIHAFRYALKSEGILFLSPSESIGSSTDLFKAIDKKYRIYQAKNVSTLAQRIGTGNLAWTSESSGKWMNEAGNKSKETNFAELTKKVLLQSYAPPSLITDDKGNILYIHGDTGKYLQPAPGHPTLNVIEMAREGLNSELRNAIRSVAKHKTPVVCNNLPVKTDGGIQRVNLIVKPLIEPDTPQELLVLSFQHIEPKTHAKSPVSKEPASKGQSKRIEELEKELAYTKESLQASIEEMQASNEELKSTNEELQSTNEEFQSTNEELETSKEELQSVNEELITVNAELQARIDQLSRMQNDMKNLLENTNIKTIFLDEKLAVKMFTREASNVYRLVPSDIGRLFAHIKSNIEGEDLAADASAVLDSLVSQEKQVKTIGGNEWYQVRIMPYRTTDNVVEGVVLTFSDITGLKKTETEVQNAREYAENIVNTIREPLIVLDSNLRAVSASRSFYNKFAVKPEDTVERHIYELGDHQWDIPKLRELLEKILPLNASFEDAEIEHDFPIIGHKKMLLNARRILGTEGDVQLILLAMEDITENLPAKDTSGQMKE